MAWHFRNHCFYNVLVRLYGGGGADWPPEADGFNPPGGYEGVLTVRCATGGSICFGAVGVIARRPAGGRFLRADRPFW